MSYQPGRMGIAEGMALVFIMLFPRIFLTTPANAIAAVTTAAWWVVIVSGLPVILAIFAWIYIFRQTPGDLFSVSEKLLGRVGAWLVTVAAIMVFFIDAALVLRQFAENTLLTALPQVEFSFIVGWYTLIAALGALLGLEALARGTYLLFPMSVMGLILVLLLLAPYYDVYNLTPWRGYGLLASLQTGILQSGINISGLILVIVSPAMQNIQTFKWASIFGVTSGLFIKSLTLFIFTMVFGVATASEKTLPFFEMSRLVYINRYFQRIEALFIILWVIGGLLGISLGLYMGTFLITRLLKLPALQPLIPLSAYIVAQMAMVPPDIATVIRLDNYLISHFYTATLFIITLVLLIAAFVKSKKRRLQHVSSYDN
ncbi:MAG: spore germination protein (amino acid permease) [Firmicutes bacterium]|nr:spore germination protein (amino acid permease) [Bacillota bacterium]